MPNCVIFKEAQTSNRWATVKNPLKLSMGTTTITMVVNHLLSGMILQVVPIIWSNWYEQWSKTLVTSHYSGWFIGILIMVYEIIPIYLGSISSPILPNQPVFCSWLRWDEKKLPSYPVSFGEASPKEGKIQAIKHLFQMFLLMEMSHVIFKGSFIS